MLNSIAESLAADRPAWSDLVLLSGMLWIGLTGLSIVALASPVFALDEFQVNTYTIGSQEEPRVSHDPDGGFVVVWHGGGDQDGDGYGVFARRYAADVSPIGSEFQVNTYTIDDQVVPAVSHDSSGGFVVVWQSWGDGSSFGIFGQRYSASRAAVGGEFQVNTYTTEGQRRASVSHSSSGGFVVVWDSFGQDGDSLGIFGQRYDTSGSAVGSEFQVNTYTTDEQQFPSLSHDASGGFVVVWESGGQDGELHGIFGQRYDASGSAVGSEFQVNTYTASEQDAPRVSHDSGGGFVVVWDSLDQDGEGGGIFGQRYDSSGNAVGNEFQVNAYTTGDQVAPRVSHDPSGGFAVVWSDDVLGEEGGRDGDGWGVFGRRYDSSGSPLGGDFQVNHYTTGDQFDASVSHDPSGAFVVVWQSHAQDGDGAGVFGRRFLVDWTVPVPSLSPWSQLALAMGLLGAGLGVWRWRGASSSAV